MDQQIIGKLVCSLLSPDETIKLSALNEINANNYWHNAYLFARPHNLIPLLYFELNKHKSKINIPTKLLENMHLFYFSITAYSLKLSHDAKLLLELFQKNNIDIMLLKGAYLAEKFYDRPSLRPMCDIDVLIKKNDIDKVSILLLQNGYTFVEHKKDSIPVGLQSHLPEIKTKNGNFIEIHWFLSPSPPYQKPIDENIIWTKAKKEKLYGVEIYAMSPEHLMIYLCCKLVADVFHGKLLQLFDIVLILNNSIDWNILIDTATKWKARKEVLSVLTAAKNLYNIRVPDSVLKSLAPEGLTPENIKYIEYQFLKTTTIATNTVEQVLSKGNPIKQIGYTLWLILSRANAVGTNWKHKIDLIFSQINRTIYQFGKNKHFYKNFLFKCKIYKKTLEYYSEKESFEKWLRK